MDRSIIGYVALIVSIVYYSILASFIGQGLFSQASLVERYVVVTTLFLMIFFNIFIGSYVLGVESQAQKGEIRDQFYKLERSEAIDEIISHKLNNLNQVALGYLNMLEEEEITDKGRDYLKRAITTIRKSGSTIETLKRTKNMDNYEKEEIEVSEILSELEDKYKTRKEMSIDIDGKFVVRTTPLISDLLEVIFSSGSNLQVRSREDMRNKYLVFRGVGGDMDISLAKMIIEDYGDVMIDEEGITLRFPKR